MSFSTVINKKQYDGNDATTVFSFPYLFQANADLTVILTDVNGNDTTLVLDTDYSVAGALEPAGGSVTYPLSGDPLATGEKTTIVREMDANQEINLSNHGAYFLAAIETALDKMMMTAQQLNEMYERCVRDTITSTETLPTAQDVRDLADQGLGSISFAAMADLDPMTFADHLMVNDVNPGEIKKITLAAFQRSVHNNTYYTAEYGSINAAVAALVSIGDPARLVVSQSVRTLTANLTIPDYIEVIVNFGAPIVEAEAYTLFIENFVAGNFEAFSGFATNKVTFGFAVWRILCSWFGVENDAADNGALINIALQAGILPLHAIFPNNPGGRPVMLHSGRFNTGVTLAIPPRVTFEGNGMANTLILAIDGLEGRVIDFEDSSSQYKSGIKSMYVSGQNKGVDGIRLASGTDYEQHNYITIQGCWITKCDVCIDADALAAKFIIYTRIYNNVISASTTGIYLDNGVNEMNIFGNAFGAGLTNSVLFSETFSGDTVTALKNSFDSGNFVVNAVAGSGVVSAKIIDNRFEGCNIQVNSAGVTAIIKDNNITQNAGPSVELSGRDCIVKDNYFSSDSASAIFAVEVKEGALRNDIRGNNYGSIAAGTNYPVRYDDSGAFTKRDFITVGEGYTAGNTYEVADRYEKEDPSSGGPWGAVCTQAGTYNTINTTGSITTSTALLTVDDADDITRGDYMTIVGLSAVGLYSGIAGVFKVLSVDGLVLTLDTDADDTVSGNAVANSAPIFKDMADLAA